MKILRKRSPYRALLLGLVAVPLAGCAAITPPDRTAYARESMAAIPASVAAALQLGETEESFSPSHARTTRAITVNSPAADPVAGGQEVATCVAITRALAATDVRATGRFDPMPVGNASELPLRMADERLCRRGLTLSGPLVRPVDDRTATSLEVYVCGASSRPVLCAMSEYRRVSRRVILDPVMNDASLDKELKVRTKPVRITPAQRIEGEWRYRVPAGHVVEVTLTCTVPTDMVGIHTLGTGGRSGRVGTGTDNPCPAVVRLPVEPALRYPIDGADMDEYLFAARTEDRSEGYLITVK